MEVPKLTDILAGTFTSDVKEELTDDEMEREMSKLAESVDRNMDVDAKEDS